MMKWNRLKNNLRIHKASGKVDTDNKVIQIEKEFKNPASGKVDIDDEVKQIETQSMNPESGKVYQWWSSTDWKAI